ncbi:dipeptidase [Rubritalea profundi]|uniref:Peptidase M20 n=1 Tax=Rubritalea profundi TaxID=1658618 RepID=A0A2S7U7L3_9BACT|nr:dipeptidase [Rubritalea profundi]PQJ30384.1 peptidase M20 [Rubritalea profundi]
MQSQLDDLFSFLRFPSISTASEHAGDVLACGQWLEQKLSGMGLSVELHETPGHPVVVARNEHKEGRKTVLIYGHYDVQPVDPIELWDTAPFEPVLKDGRIWGRGTSDNKGQMMAHVLGVEKTLKEHGELPVNLIFLFEGEEEIGSPNLVPFLEAHKAELACDIIAVSDTGMVARGVPTMGYGLRGITCCEVTVKGPSGDLHSGCYGGAVANPVTAVARLVASLHDAEGNIAIEGFYDDVKPLENWEREMWAQIPGMSDQDMMGLTGAPAVFGEPGYSTAERLWARPTAEVNGIGGGYQGEGSKTVLPAEAMAKFSFRLVPNQVPEDISKKVQAHLEKHAPVGVTVEVEVGHDGKPYYSDPNSPYGKAGQIALEKSFGKKPVLIREGGSIPIIKDMQDILGADSLLLGLSLPDCQIHAPNENFWVENFEAGIEMNAILLKELAKV